MTDTDFALRHGMATDTAAAPFLIHSQRGNQMRTISQSRYTELARGVRRRMSFPLRLLCFVFLSTAAWFVLIAPLFFAF